MHKLLSSSTQAKPISHRRAKKPPAPDCPTLSGSSRRISTRTSQVHAPSRPLEDPDDHCSMIQTRTRRRKLPESHDDPNSSPQILIWGAKRARGSSAGIQADSCSASRRDWTDLGDGPAGLIAERLLAGDVADYVCFRAVCRPWRLCCTDPRAHGILDRRFHPRHWIMLRETGDSPRRRCLNVSTGRSRCVRLPELHGHDVFGPTTEGLLVLLDRATWVVRLLNPVTRQTADLPPATTLMAERDLERATATRDLLQVAGAGLADDCTIAVHFRLIRTLAVIKPGDPHWTVVDRGTWLLPAMSFAGRFYCATTAAVMVVETSADEPPRLVIAANLKRLLSPMMVETVHLVDNGGELILVDRQCTGDIVNRKYTRKCTVYRVDLDSRKMVRIRGLGGRAVFMGTELALSVSPSVFPSIDADAIYLGFDGRMIGTREDKSLIHLVGKTADAEPRQLGGSIDGMPLYEPLGLDIYLSWCVASFRHTLMDMDCNTFPNRALETHTQPKVQTEATRRISNRTRKPSKRFSGREWVTSLEYKKERHPKK
ncbi:hypothetical protein CFC21_101681 [Triticum aestivum]|uniref:KIB1-4 beta-propeller domain-containing protein n=2 Tax=Triticum aestivum TaxID=4565 RepID=A0A9R1N483_WHEAT|nr:hypothetical protein CFC21_101681 [Triticum aestivum]